MFKTSLKADHRHWERFYLFISFGWLPPCDIAFYYVAVEMFEILKQNETINAHILSETRRYCVILEPLLQVAVRFDAYVCIECPSLV